MFKRHPRKILSTKHVPKRFCFLIFAKSGLNVAAVLHLHLNPVKLPKFLSKSTPSDPIEWVGGWTWDFMKSHCYCYFMSFFLNQTRGKILLPIQTLHYWKGNSSKSPIHLLLAEDPPKMGKSMTPKKLSSPTLLGKSSTGSIKVAMLGSESAKLSNGNERLMTKKTQRSTTDWKIVERV